VLAATSGADITLEDLVYDKLWAKRCHNGSDSLFNDDCYRKATAGHIPRPNRFPRNLREARIMIKAKEWKAYEV